MVDNNPNRETHGQSSIKPAGDAPPARKLWPLLLGALALLVLLFLLLRGCDEADDPVATTDTTTTTTQTAAPTVAAAAPVAYSADAFNRTLTGTEPLPVSYTLDQVTFDTGSAELNAAAQEEIRGVAQALQGRSTARVSLRGYADPSGDAAANQALSERRVAAVRDAMIAAGVSADQIVAGASGETGDAATRENRRVEITLQAR